MIEDLFNEYKIEYPERKLHLIDTKGITILSNIIVKEIGDMYLAGKSVEEIMEWATKEVDHYATYFYADDLKFFQRSVILICFRSAGIRYTDRRGSDFYISMIM